jgi:hypothetical protein
MGQNQMKCSHCGATFDSQAKLQQHEQQCSQKR